MKNRQPRKGLTPINRRNIALSLGRQGKGKNRTAFIRANISRNHDDSEKPIARHIASKAAGHYDSKRAAY